MKNNRFLIIISILSFIFMLLGTTFSYFSSSVKSEDNVISMSSAVFGTDVVISALYNENKIIPMNDDDVIKAYNNMCVDSVGYGACYAYNIDIINNGDKMGYTGSILFNVENITRLSYLLLDEDSNRYVDVTKVQSGIDQTLGNSFELEKNESRHFKLIIWLSNVDENQIYVDNGLFNAFVTYDTTYGSKITGTFTASNHGG